MQTVIRTWRTLLVAVSTVFFAAAIATLGTTVGADGSSPPSPALPQVPLAIRSAQWLTGKLTPGGYIPGGSPGTANYSETVNTLLALGAANVNLALARTGLAYMEDNADAYIAANGSDGPGQLSLLILTAHALGADPTNFGGTNLVSRLLATEQPNGRFGTDAQVPAFNSGPYDQGLALAALKAVGLVAPAASVSWLQQAQCPNGGWTAPDPVDNPCNGDPGIGGGPDTNTTALALQGLAAQSSLTQSISSSALSFLETGQNADGGWAYDPAAADNVQTSDPNSTSLVIQALLALGLAPDSQQFTVSGHTPTSLLLSFEVTSGADRGAFYSPFGSPSTGDVFATFQAVPALMAVSFPFGPSGATYWLAASDGGVFGFGGAWFHGSLGGLVLNKPVVAIAPTLDGQGYRLAASDGGVFNYGNAGFLGSMGGTPLNKPVVGIAAGAEGKGYWLVAADGGIFNYGDAGFLGSMGARPLNAPIVGMASTPDGAGYWLVASDGGIFAFGDAAYFGSMGGRHLNAPVEGMATTPDGGGYWLVASDGGIFAFGDAAYFGSMGGRHLNAPVKGMATTPDGGGYWLVASDGGVFTFGDAIFSGSMGGTRLNAAMVGMAPSAS
jgi:hypothetical protein